MGREGAREESSVVTLEPASHDDAGELATLRVGALEQSDSNRFYERHGFELVEVGEWDNYYVRKARGAA